LNPGTRYHVFTTYKATRKRATNAPYTITFGPGANDRATVLVNQKRTPNDDFAYGQAWESLGVYAPVGNTLSITLTDDANGKVVADAVRAIEIPPVTETPEIIDDGDSAYAETGSGWTTGPTGKAYGSDIRRHDAGTGQNTASWTFEAIDPGTSYEVFATWTPTKNRANSAPYMIIDGATTKDIVDVDQRDGPNDLLLEGIGWKSLGAYTIDNGKLTVTLSDNANGRVVADAIRIVEAGAVVGLAAPTQVLWGMDISLRATVSDPDGTTIQSVAFYRDENGNRALDADDTPLGVDIVGNDGWTWNDDTILPEGSYTFFAEASTFNGPINWKAAEVTVAADAAILDDGDVGFQAYGNGWSPGSLGAGDALGGDYQAVYFSRGTNSAIWSFDDLPVGTYDVYVSYVGASNHVKKAPLKVFIAAPGTGGYLSPDDQVGSPRFVDQSTPVTADLQADGRDWEKIGRATTDNGNLSVLLDAGGSYSRWAVADAVRLERIDHVQGVIHDISLHVGLDGPRSRTIDLDEAFAGVASLSGKLVYSITGDTDPSVLALKNIDQADGTLTLLPNDAAGGETTLTVTAEDASLTTAHAVFTVTVNDNLIHNGSFEEPAIGEGWGTFHSIPYWSLESGPNFEIQHGILGGPSEGLQHAELDAYPVPGSIAISQTFDTEPGGLYRLRFAFAGRPGTGLENNVLGVEISDVTPDVASGLIDFQLLDDAQNPVVGDPAASGDSGWHYYTAAFAASGTRTKLRFQDLGTSDTYGTFIDDVSLVHQSSNTAPELSPANQRMTVERSAAQTPGAGMSVSEIAAAIADADSHDTLGIAVTSVEVAHGYFEYTIDSGQSWQPVGAVSETSALLLSPYDCRIRFRPDSDYLGPVPDALVYLAWDGTSGTTGTKVDASRGGGPWAFSTDSNSIDVVVTGNSPPIATDDTFALASDDAALVIDVQSDLLTNDTDPDGDTLMFSLIANPSVGTLTYHSASDSLAYDPNGELTAPVIFVYAIDDGFGRIDTATVTIKPPEGQSPTPSLSNGATLAIQAAPGPYPTDINWTAPLQGRRLS